MDKEINTRLQFLRESLAISKSNLPVEERITERRKLISTYFPQQRSAWHNFWRWLFGKKTSDNDSYRLESSASYIFLGRDLEEIGRLDEALGAYAKARSYDSMAQVYLKLGQRENALIFLKLAKQGRRNPPKTLLLEAEIRGECGDYNEVARLLNLAFCRTPENEETPQIYQRIHELGERFSVPIPRLPNISLLARTAPRLS